MNYSSEKGRRYILPDMDGIRRKTELITQHRERGNADARKRLLSFLADESWHVREAAVNALGAVGGVSAHDLRELAEGGVWYVRAAVAQVLGLTGGVEAVPMLAQLSHETNRSVQEAAEDAIRRISAREGAEKVLALIESVDGSEESTSEQTAATREKHSGAGKKPHSAPSE